MSNKQLKKLIDCLSALELAQKPAMKDIIHALTLDYKSKQQPTDNALAEKVVTIISILPDVMHDKQNQPLAQFCKGLRPKQPLTLSKPIYDLLFNIETPEPKPNASLRR